MPTSPEGPVRRILAERESLDVPKILEKRGDLLTALNRSRALLDHDDAKGASALVGPLEAMDPLGGATALEGARAALGAGDPAQATRAARIAALSGGGRADVVAPAYAELGQALEKLERPRDALDAYAASLAEDPGQVPLKKAVERLQKAAIADVAPPPPASAPVGSVEEACASIERDVRSGKVGEVSFPGGAATAVDCASDGTLDVDTPTLRRAYAFRFDIKGFPLERLVWVALEGGTGLSLYGPVAHVYGAGGGPANDVIVDLQKIDVLPGGAPEIVVKIIERQTLPDIALNEVLETDETRAVLLSVDRGGIVASRTVVLSSRRLRAKIDPKAKGMPRGFAAGVGLGRAAEFSTKVAWGGPNSMTLTVTSGNAKPKLVGDITLFP